MKLSDLLLITSVKGIDPATQIEIVGALFDWSFDSHNTAGIEHGITLAKQIEVDKLDCALNTILLYNLSNGWGYMRKLKYRQTQADWNFQSEELTKEIFYLRKALTSSGFSEVNKERQCQIYTNLGNAFSYIGRFVEAQEYWNNALEIDPIFSMAIGNKANGLYHYAYMLYDNIHCNLFLVFAYHHLKKALKYPEFLYPDAIIGFKDLLTNFDQYISQFPEEYVQNLPSLDHFDLGTDETLKSYRQWCLVNTLYINPLNDLGYYTEACHDCLNMPTLTISKERPPVFINLFNQIKQEYGTARFFYFNSMCATDMHFSDIDVPLVETIEVIAYSYNVEQIKIAFRLSYSILDKIAYLLNDYLQLQIPPNKVSFRSLWYNDKKQFRPFFQSSDNWALRGLFWLSKDLYERENEFDTVLEPEAKEIATIRNFMEHKGFKVLADFRLFEPTFTEADISYTIDRSELERKTLKLLKLTRAAIMYAALAVSHEERKKDYSGAKVSSIQATLIPQHSRV